MDTMQNQLGSIIDNCLTYLGGASWESVTPGFKPKGKLTAWSFDGAEPLLSEVTSLIHEPLGVEYFADVRPRDLTKIVDMCVLNKPRSDDAGKYQFALYRIRSLDLPDVRGQVRCLPPTRNILEHRCAYISKEGQAEALSLAFGEFKANDWVCISSIKPPSKDVAQAWTHMIQAMLGMWFTKRYQWRVYLAYDEMPGLEFPTDPIGAQEVFRLRDLPEGRSRRAALRHWVEEHWRQHRADPFLEGKVREHLRGGTLFKWSGLRCKIKVSDFDVERNEQLREHREEERKLGTDVRRIGGAANLGG